MRNKKVILIAVVLAIVAAACQQGGAEEATTAATDGTTGTTVGDSTTAAGGEPSTPYTYRLGIFEDTTTDNYWAAQDTLSTVWNSYVLTPTKPALYTINYPGLEVVPDLSASPEIPVGEAEGDGWAITVPLRSDAAWSDGTAISADDIVFTFETVRDLALGGDWLTWYPLTNPDNPNQIGLTGVEAVDASTVKFIFNIEPGLAVWPHGPGVAPVMPAHFWADAVAAASTSEDPLSTLYAASGVGDPSGGPMIYSEREEGGYTRSIANTDYYANGDEVDSGGVSYANGPFVTDAIFSLYGGQDAAVLALQADEIDYILNPLGMQRGLVTQVQNDPTITAIINPTNGFRYLGFNLRRSPMNIPEFRDALALMIDKEFMANNVLQGVAIPFYASIPEGNTKWYNAEVVEEIASEYVGKSTGDRLDEAMALLRQAGFTWEVEPTMDEADVTVLAGSGIMLNGQPVPELEILAPGPGYDPLRATYSVWVETWLEQLGFEANANPTDFNAIVDAVYTADSNNELNFDMFILGWSLGNPALPTHYEAFWSARNDTLLNGGNNSVGFNNPEFESLIDQFNATQDESEAYRLMWEMERILADEKPYVLLFDTGILEFYRQANVAYPFTETLYGLQNLQGLQGVVRGAK
jgi:peptide/nickel transport system substrate-binding protein